MPELYDVTVYSGVQVTFDERFFTEQRRAEFRRYYYYYDYDTLEQHAHHIAKLTVRDVPSRYVFTDAGGMKHDFYRIEGYGWVVIDEEDPAVLGSEWSGVRVAYDDQKVDTDTQEWRTL